MRVVPLIRQITPKNKKFKKLKLIDKVKQRVYVGVINDAKSKMDFIFVLGKLNPANRSGLNFWKYTPQMIMREH